MSSLCKTNAIRGECYFFLATFLTLYATKYSVSLTVITHAILAILLAYATQALLWPRVFTKWFI